MIKRVIITILVICQSVVLPVYAYAELSRAISGETPLSGDGEKVFVASGQTVKKSLEMPRGVLQAALGINWRGGDFGLTLVHPDGYELTPGCPDHDYDFRKASTYAFYIVDNPEPGNWVLKIKVLNVPPEGVNVVTRDGDMGSSINHFACVPLFLPITNASPTI
ncbi:MAG: hypothetical protein AB1500_02860 [Bacillota bacterium]